MGAPIACLHTDTCHTAFRFASAQSYIPMFNASPVHVGNFRCIIFWPCAESAYLRSYLLWSACARCDHLTIHCELDCRLVFQLLGCSIMVAAIGVGWRIHMACCRCAPAPCLCSSLPQPHCQNALPGPQTGQQPQGKPPQHQEQPSAS